ncbi:phospholipid phosphatase 5 isoform X2 [Vulpes lagopus]|uniref:phospholipid phosphatase 5 isoform X2 n=1 Tax=Vulpes lagopus TaxID=494514 RepID=UPI001BC9FABE|nr:phospholipid phosphatase 5 isoform X2 [Vulpes lagopus]
MFQIKLWACSLPVVSCLPQLLDKKEVMMGGRASIAGLDDPRCTHTHTHTHTHLAGGACSTERSFKMLLAASKLGAQSVRSGCVCPAGGWGRPRRRGALLRVAADRGAAGRRAARRDARHLDLVHSSGSTCAAAWMDSGRRLAVRGPWQAPASRLPGHRGGDGAGAGQERGRGGGGPAFLGCSSRGGRQPALRAEARPPGSALPGTASRPAAAATSAQRPSVRPQPSRRMGKVAAALGAELGVRLALFAAFLGGSSRRRCGFTGTRLWKRSISPPSPCLCVENEPSRTLDT